MDKPESPISVDKREINHETDLLRVGSWHYMAGVHAGRNGLELTPTGLAIVNKREGGRIDPNLPLNVYGTRLQAESDFAISADIQSDGPVALQLYGQVPLRFDDFRYERARLECLTSGNTLTVRIWDGSQQEPVEAQDFPFDGSATDRQIEVRREGGKLLFSVNGQEQEAIMRAGIFQTGEVWLGVNSEQKPAHVKRLTAQPLHGYKLELVDTSSLRVTEPLPAGLQSLVHKPGFRIGAAAALNPMVSDEKYAQLFLGGEVGSITTENALKPQDVQPLEGVFTFDEGDALVDAAHRQRRGIAVHGHTLVYDKAMPKWMQELPYDTEAEKQRMREVLETHVKTVVGHFKGRMISWDVVNEAIDGFNQGAHLRDSIWFKGLGEEYIDIAFRAAHEADPEARLYINDYGMETNPQGRGQFMLDLVARARKRGVPIHGVGIEGHVYQIPRDTIKPDVLRKLMQDFEAIGVKVRVSELDVTAAKGDAAQAQQCADVLKVCLEASNCDGLTIWGLTDAYGSTAGLDQGRLKPGSALPYTTDYRPKPARTALADTLRHA